MWQLIYFQHFQMVSRKREWVCQQRLSEEDSLGPHSRAVGSINRKVSKHLRRWQGIKTTCTHGSQTCWPQLLDPEEATSNLVHLFLPSINTSLLKALWRCFKRSQWDEDRDDSGEGMCFFFFTWVRSVWVKPSDDVWSRHCVLCKWFKVCKQPKTKTLVFVL